MPPALAVLTAYLGGSVPFAYLVGKAFRGIDLRHHGSGNLGATNVFRVMGARLGILVLTLDVAKGALPVLYLPRMSDLTPGGWWTITIGLAAILGHVRPIFLLLRGGGKGVATAAGVFLGLAPVATLGAIAVWSAVLLASGFVSLASLTAALSLPLTILLRDGVRSPLVAVSAAVAAFVTWTHRANIRRLRRGEEHRFRPKKTT
jgi:glycerol-3-phosphate acyltransferase PlsY